MARAVEARGELTGTAGAYIHTMTTFHHLSVVAEPGGLVFTCDDGCARRVVVDRDRGELVVIDRGDPLALHRGSIGGVALAEPRVTPM